MRLEQSHTYPALPSAQRALAWLTLAALLFALNVPVVSRTAPDVITHSLPAPDEAVTHLRLESAFGQLPLYFVENRGQLDERVAYYIQGSDKTIYFTSAGVTFALTSQTLPSDDAHDRHSHATTPPYSRWAVKLDFVGANPGARPAGIDQTEAVISYFKGRPDEWRTGLPTYAGLVYRDLWPGIDLIYSGTFNQLKYQFVVKPGADPQQIQLAYRGATSVKINAAEQLEVTTPLGGFTDDVPYAYQETAGGQRVEVSMAYQLATDALRVADVTDTLSDTDDSYPLHQLHAKHPLPTYTFRLGDYDPTRPLILDPAVLVYAGYIGGSDSDDSGGIAVDSAGNAYVTGVTNSTEATFPVTSGPDLTFNGNDDAFVAKVNPAGTGLVYAGYIGGSAIDASSGIAVDSAGNAYVTGRTYSTEATFPVVGGPDLTFNGGYEDAFVAKVNAAGTGLVYAGYIGGSNYDEGNDIAVDSAGNTYVMGITYSDQTTFPVAGGPDLTYNGSQDAFMAKVNAAGTGLVYAGYIGGSGNDWGFGIAVDGAGNAYVTGVTSSDQTTFPVAGGPDLTYNGRSEDAFVAKVNPAGTGLVYAGYVGGSGDDEGNDIAVDGAGNAYVTGTTDSTEATFPVAGGPDLTYNGGWDAFVTKVNAAGTGLVYAGYIGGSYIDAGYGIAVDSAGNAYVTGYTASTEATFPVVGGPDLTYNGAGDAFVAKVSEGGVSGSCYSLAVSSTTGGAVSIQTPQNCAGGYLDTTTVVLKAIPASGYQFSIWSGVDTNPDSALANVVMTGNRSVTASFALVNAGQKPVVVLVHGWHGKQVVPEPTDECYEGQNDSLPYQVTSANLPDNFPSNYDFGAFAGNLINDGWDVWIAHVETGPAGTPPIEYNATCLKWQLSQIPKPNGKVVLIAHSMGGLVSRAYLESNLYANNVSRLITLGTPHAGTPLGDLYCSSNYFRDSAQYDHAACQFSIGGVGNFNSTYSPRRNGVTYDFIGGDKTPFGLIAPVLAILGGQGWNDGVVGAQSSVGRIYRPLLPPTEVVGGGTRHIFGASHGGVMRNIEFPLFDFSKMRVFWRTYTVGLRQWFPSYFNTELGDQTTPTDSYQCVRQLIGRPALGIPPGSCGTQAAMLAPLQTMTSPVVSQIPPLLDYLSNGQVVTHTMPVDTSGQSQFDLAWVTGTVGLTLTNPLGTVIDPTYAVAHPEEVAYSENITATASQPFVSYAFTTTVPGVYTLTITAGDVGTDGTDYVVSTWVDSPRTLTVATDSTLYPIGSTAMITASMQNAGTGLTGATVEAKLYRPGLVTDTITLAEQGGGIYTGTYTIPNAPGYLGLTVVAEGDDAGVAYARQVDSLLAISPQTAQLNGQYSDSPTDVDGDGKYDSLDIGVGITSTQAGNYLLSGDLIDISGTVVVHSVISVTLGVGEVTATLPFNGDDIRQSGLNGPYTLTNLTIADQQNAGVPAIWLAQNVWTTAAYTATDFAATCYLLETSMPVAGGTIAVDPAPNCNAGLQYTSGTVVMLTATANTGYAFANWSGDVAGPANPITATVDADKTIVANFDMPPSDVAVSGPTTGAVSIAYAFTATVSPITATLPITYLWEAIGQTPVTNTGSLTSTATFNWIESGPKTITVTATNIGGTITGTQAMTINVPPTSVAISGPTTGIPQTGYTFTATVSPISATVPITYLWEATGQSPVTNTSNLTNTIAFTWTTPGPKAITVTATNAAGAVSGSYTITIQPCYTLTTSADPSNGGRVDASPPLNCANGTEYVKGTVVTLTATANTGYVFANWSGDVGGTANPTPVTMDADKFVAANFVAQFRLYLPLVRR
jgi:pimeloyl-ACP methyl ester carboxylesterase